MTDFCQICGTEMSDGDDGCMYGHSRPSTPDPRIEGWNAAIEAARQKRHDVADMIGAKPCSVVHSALCEYANSIRAIPCPYQPKEGKQ